MHDFLASRRAYGLGLALAGLLAAGCERGTPEPRESLTVFCAASLDRLVQEFAAGFESKTGVKVDVHSGASGTLRKQIESGAPASVFLSADVRQIDALVDAGFIRKESRRVLAQNRLVIATRRGTADDPDLPVALAGARYHRMAIATPDAAPAGRYARQALEHAGIWDSLQDKLVIADDVRAAAKYAELDTVDAAIVYQTDAQSDSELRIAYVFPLESHDPCLYVAGVITRNERETSHQFLEFLTSRVALPVWRKHGFDPPPDPEPRP